MLFRMGAPDVTAEPRPPLERVGSYVLVRRIGSGGMGEVWLGRHVVAGTLGAVKRVSPVVAGPVEDFFRREGRAIARLAHPHIVPVVEVGEDFLVTAFVDGSNLARRLQTPIDPGTAVRIVRQIASALAHAHERGVVHRDVKPSNILIDTRGNAHLADFGVATFADEDTRHRIAGTPRFMAPEQRRGEKVGPAADQYALGRTLCEMLCGGAVPTDMAKALDELAPDLPRALRDVIARATEFAPELRFPGIQDFADALGAIDLGDAAPQWRLAPIARAPHAFAWLAGAHTVTRVTAELERADYRLSELVGQGLIDRAAVDAFLARRGLADVGFAVWAQSARLGPITDPRMLARAAEAVVLVHGWSGTREVWSVVAPALCRDNAQAVVIAPDLHGFGETPFDGVPKKEHVELVSMAHSAEALRELLGLADVPVALVGHSMGATSLLSLSDEEVGPHVSRVLINPVLVSHNARLRRKMRGIARVTSMFGRIPALRRWTVDLISRTDPNVTVLTDEMKALFIRESLRMPGGVYARLLSAFHDSPPKLGRQRRLAIIACLDDSWIDERRLDDVARDLGIEASQIHRVASGGHSPHLELKDHPEWTARNIDQIVRVIDSMLITARERTMVSTEPRAIARTGTSGSSSDEPTATAQTFTKA
jgi:pimeloyl-ACP methyl ester carboxylesterase